jgi:hypothetical protein
VKDLVEEMKDIPRDDIKRRELSYKATKDVIKCSGLYPTAQYAQTLYNVYNDNRRQTVITPDYQKFLDFQARELEVNDKENS